MQQHFNIQQQLLHNDNRTAKPNKRLQSYSTAEDLEKLLAGNEYLQRKVNNIYLLGTQFMFLSLD